MEKTLGRIEAKLDAVNEKIGDHIYADEKEFEKIERDLGSLKESRARYRGAIGLLMAALGAIGYRIS
jgi:hypothetical protein